MPWNTVMRIRFRQSFPSLRRHLRLLRRQSHPLLFSLWIRITDAVSVTPEKTPHNLPFCCGVFLCSDKIFRFPLLRRHENTGSVDIIDKQLLKGEIRAKNFSTESGAFTLTNLPCSNPVLMVCVSNVAPGVSIVSCLKFVRLNALRLCSISPKVHLLAQFTF